MTGAWPAGRPRVLVTDAWLANAGDGAIAIAVDQMVRAVAPDAAVLHAAYQGEAVGRSYPDLELVPPLATLVGIEGAPPAPRGWRASTLGQLVDEADLVVSQGGGFLLEHYQPWERLFALAEAVGRDRPLVLLGHTIGAFRMARARALLRRILRAALHVAVRDGSSHAHALALGADPERLAVTSDLSLSLFGHEPEPRARTGVAVVLTTHEEAEGGGEEREALAHEVLAEVIARTGDEPVTVASTVQGLGAAGFEDDGPAGEAAAAALPKSRRSAVTVTDGYLAPREAIALFGACRAIVSQRLHPALFALGQGVPAALLLSADKAGVLEGAGLGRLVCREPADPAARARALDAALGTDAPSAPALWDALDPVRQRARYNTEILREALAGIGAI